MPDEREVTEVRCSREHLVGERVAPQAVQEFVGPLVERLDPGAEVALAGRSGGGAGGHSRQSAGLGPR